MNSTLRGVRALPSANELTMERKTMQRALAGVVITLLLTACGRSETTADIAQIRIFASECIGCSPTAYVLNSDGTTTFGENSAFAARGPRTIAPLIQEFPLDQFRWASSNNLRVRLPLSLALVRVDFRDGAHLDASVPTLDAPIFDETGRLQRWLDIATHVSRDVAFGPRARTIEEALKRGLLTSTRLETLGCFGSCPTYVATFTRHGATIVDKGPNCNVKAHAFVGIRRVEVALREGGASQLLPVYPPKWIDTPGARITLVINGRTYESEGRDVMSWQRPFATSVARLDQIVRDTDWTPAIDLTGCARHMRRVKQ